MASDLDAAIRRRLAPQVYEEGFLRHEEAVAAISAILDKANTLEAGAPYGQTVAVRFLARDLRETLARALHIDSDGDD